MKKNGFLSVTTIFAFFLVFLSIMTLIIVSMSNNRYLLNQMKKTIKNDISDTNFSRYLVNRYEELNLVYHDSNLENGLNDKSYRFVGSNPNNYVKFNGLDKVFRIIGVFNGKVKVIDNSSFEMAWNNTEEIYNFYGESTINTYLNSTYLNELVVLNDKIENRTYYIGGINREMVSKTGYEISVAELNNSGSYLNTKIALPYISDYVYAGSNYNTKVSKSDNWMFTSNLWFITRRTDNIIDAFYLTDAGDIESELVTTSKKIKPVFYLKNSVLYLSGSGTSTEPYVVG